METEKLCTECNLFVQLEYISKECIAPYGSIIMAYGYCPHCNSLMHEYMADNDGLFPSRRDN